MNAADDQGRFALAGTTNATERLSADDMATRREEQFLAAALRNHARAAVRLPSSLPGRCMNCLELCVPTAIYCDAECRVDHERRVGAVR